ncbi:MAG: hypothetical protein OXF56_22835 [Rhodobacteraceae bacterium]|nr:hypothetical protein [Paracoccaceae bacterium]
MSPGDFATEIDGLTANGPGVVSICLVDAKGDVVTFSNRMSVRDSELVQYSGDLHGQSEETIGTGTAEQYLAFARDRAFLDACAHQGNDFRITDAFWNRVNSLTARFDQPGRFVALPGYE